MPFRDRFDCLWCGSPHQVRGPDDLEGWAQLCPACVGRAGENPFLRFRVRRALEERAAAQPLTATPPAPPAAAPSAPPAALPAPPMPTLDFDSDDRYLRRGRFERGPVHDAAWNAELDAAGRWLDSLPLGGEILELAAGTGWWAPLLASKGTLTVSDPDAAALDRARERLVAHRLRAHLHERDPFAEPDREVDVLFTAFWLTRLDVERLDAFLALARRWLRPGGRYVFVDGVADRQSGETVEVPHDATELEAALRRAGFAGATVSSTGRFFLLGDAVA